MLLRPSAWYVLKMSNCVSSLMLPVTYCVASGWIFPQVTVQAQTCDSDIPPMPWMRARTHAQTHTCKCAHVHTCTSANNNRISYALSGHLYISNASSGLLWFCIFQICLRCVSEDSPVFVCVCIHSVWFMHSMFAILHVCSRCYRQCLWNGWLDLGVSCNPSSVYEFVYLGFLWKYTVCVWWGTDWPLEWLRSKRFYLVFCILCVKVSWEG